MDEQYRWQQFLEGTQQALADIFLFHHDDLFRYGLKLTGNQEMVKDCIQDLFLKLWKNRHNLQMVHSVKPYLFKSLRNHLVDSAELQRPDLPISDEMEGQLQIIYSHEDFIIHDQVNDEIRQQVIHALNKLSKRQREAIYLRYFEELDFETIANLMDMNLQSVRNTLSRAMMLLRDLMLLYPFLLMLNKADCSLTDLF
jgi:RNA polymerase sigma factor (sigma-70 family)